MPEKRQTLLFTATVTEPILALRDSSEKPPFVHVCDMETSTVSTLDQLYVFVPSHVRQVYLSPYLAIGRLQGQVCDHFLWTLLNEPIDYGDAQRLGYPLHSIAFGNVATRTTQLSGEIQGRSDQSAGIDRCWQPVRTSRL